MNRALFQFLSFRGLIIIFSILIFPRYLHAQHFQIEKFHSDIAIYEDGNVTVTERIDVEFHRPKHGIYRVLPYKYINEFGKTVKTPIEVISVKDGGGRPWKYSLQHKGGFIYIRIGDPKIYVEGRKTYIIEYMVRNVILFLKDHDELYWNVTGNDWKATIMEASATVTLVSGKKSETLSGQCYTGHYGSHESQCKFETDENIANFITARSLRTGEGFTVAIGWEKGLVRPPSDFENFLMRIDIRENWVFLIPIISLVFMTLRWYRKGRDPRVREAIQVMYEPPKFKNSPLSPSEVGVLIDEKINPRDITSSIIGLAVKGYINIKEIKKEGLIFDTRDYSLKKVKEPDDGLDPFEKELMMAIFSSKKEGAEVLVSQLKNRFYTHLGDLKRLLYGELLKKGYFLVNPENVKGVYIIAGIFVLVSGFFISAIFTPSTFGKSIVAWILAGVPFFAFAGAMPAKTKKGALARIEILGFQEFMNRADRDWLKRFGEKELFYKYLPYAISLDVVDHWAEAFEGIYHEPPSWYSSADGFRIFSPSIFSHSINSAISGLSSAIFSAPRGSGSGGVSMGGGFSGGGFGGGGGRSW